MDRLNQLRGEAGSSRDSTLDTSSPPSEAYMTANESSSKYYSLSDVDSTFDISPIKDVCPTIETETSITEPDRLISNLSPIGKKNDFLDSYKIGKQIEAANILSGGVDIFDDNDNSYDGDELVIDDNVEGEEKCNADVKLAESDFKEDSSTETTLVDSEPVPRKDSTEVILQIDGKNVDAIDIGNGLYLYRKEGEEELAAVQIDEDQQQPNFKFLKVRENHEGNLEVYEEIQIEVPKEVPAQEGNSDEANVTPIKDINKVISDVSISKVTEKKSETENAVLNTIDKAVKKDTCESKLDANGKLMKFSESRKSPLIGSFTPMTYHSTPIKEGIPLTKTMVDLHLHPNRQSDNVKKTIEVHTDVVKPKLDKCFKDIEDKVKIDETAQKTDKKGKCLVSTSCTESSKYTYKDEKVDIEKISKIYCEDIEKANVSKTECLNKVMKDNINCEDKEIVNTGKIECINKIDVSGKINCEDKEKANISKTECIGKFDVSEKIHCEDKEESNTSKTNSIGKIDVKENTNCEVKEKANTSKTECIGKIDVSKKINCEDKEKANISKKEDLRKIDVRENKDKANVNETEYLSKDGGIEEKTIGSDTKLESIVRISNQTGTDPKSEETEACTEFKSIEKNVSEKKLNDAVKDSLLDSNKNNKAKFPIIKTDTLKLDAKVEIVQNKTTITDNVYPGENIVEIVTDVKKIEGAIKDTDKHFADHHCKEIRPDNVYSKKLTEVSVIENDKSAKVENVLNMDSVSSDGKAVSLVDTGLISDVTIMSTTTDDVSKVSSVPNTLTKINTTQEQNLMPPDNIKPKLKESIKPEPIKIVTPLKTKDSTVNSTPIKIIEQKVLVSKEFASQKQSSITGELDICNAEATPLLTQKANQHKEIITARKTSPKMTNAADQKPINISNVAVPFGKWTEANRQAFLNKIKETKVPSNSSNGKQIKNSNDLNRRDVLKKIDSHRQAHTNIISANVKVQDFGSSNRLPIKKEASVFSCKPDVQDSKVSVKIETYSSKTNPVTDKKLLKQESFQKSLINSESITNESTALLKKELPQRKEINNQDLIDKTIEDIINRAIPVKSQSDNVHDIMNETLHALQDKEKFDEIEKKMNELHGTSYLAKTSDSGTQRADKKVVKSDIPKDLTIKQSKIPSLLPFPNKNQRKGVKENIIDIDSEEEVIEHEPITGDMDLNKKPALKLPISDKSESAGPINPDDSKKGAIITENDFDKFVRRNSISYENCITVNFDSKEHHNVLQTVVQKESVLKTYSKHDYTKRSISSLKPETAIQSANLKPNQNTSKVRNIHNEETTNKNYQSKVKMAYKNAITAKRQSERPITIIEDKPVKVVFMDSVAEFNPKQLNVQGNELSPSKKHTSSIDMCVVTTSDSLDSDIIDDGKYQDEIKQKTKHQRKQVLTPVVTPELELIEADDLGIEVSPKKKRKIEDRIEKSPKTVVPKKTYLLGRGATVENEVSKPYEHTNIFEKETLNVDNNHITHKNTASAIDNLVKAAELLETQSENLTKTSLQMQNSDSQQNTPVKRGRGRPRKYPLPEGAVDNSKLPIPQKKPRLSNDKPAISPKDNTHRNWNTDDDDSSDGEIIRENWTMGKINENIVCPICNKLFRSENVVFKHVKHCTGPSPNRSESSNKSPRRYRDSQDSESKSDDSKLDENDVDDNEIPVIEMRKKRKSRDTNPKSMTNKEEVIVIDTPVKSKTEKNEGFKLTMSKKATVNKGKVFDKGNDLMCEICGKTFRQLSYLVNHKLQHQKDGSKKYETEMKTTKSIFSCEVCKKEFRKLHHLVQHRFIHNPTSATSTKLSRKSSSEQNDDKASKAQSVVKQNDDASAGFRCEPCDKSFRKLHHLVEHRETHDGINRQRNTTITGTVEKTQVPPQCDICKKTFRKLHHLIEHKEQHLDTVSEKSDDKSVKSSLSTKDIIHECPLCYMVFPNEHSLTKHTIICQRKKRQAASKQSKPSVEQENDDKSNELDIGDEEFDKDDEVILVSTEIITNEKDIASDTREGSLTAVIDKNDSEISANVHTNDLPSESPKPEITIEKPKELEISRMKPLNEREQEAVKVILDLPNSVKKLEERESTRSLEILNKKSLVKEKLPPKITKRQKSNLASFESKESSEDDDEIRYMLNPDYNMDDNSEEKLFMKVRANKRNSLQVERPNSKDLIKRRISLQHQPKIPRLKPKPVQIKTMVSNAAALTKKAKPEPAPFTDSDDSDIKYSFPKTITSKVSKSNIEASSSKERKVQKKSLAEKRKSLSGIAKRKSVGKPNGAKHKLTQPSPLSAFKKRIAEVQHRCDCGELFSSAALLARHTTLAHTPPRIRRRRSPPPPPDHRLKPEPKKATTTPKPQVSTSRKSSVKIGGVGSSTAHVRPAITRKSSAPKTENKTSDSRKTPKSSEPPKSSATDPKVRRYAAHKGVPVPAKMRKLMEKSKK